MSRRRRKRHGRTRVSFPGPAQRAEVAPLPIPLSCTTDRKRQHFATDKSEKGHEGCKPAAHHHRGTLRSPPCCIGRKNSRGRQSKRGRLDLMACSPHERENSHAIRPAGGILCWLLVVVDVCICVVCRGQAPRYCTQLIPLGSCADRPRRRRNALT